MKPAGDGLAKARGAVAGGRQRVVRPAGVHRAVGESTVLQQAVIQHQGAGDREVEGESGRDADDVVTALQQVG